MPTLYILELYYSSVVKSAKISTILYNFVRKIENNIDRIAMVIWKYP